MGITSRSTAIEKGGRGKGRWVGSNWTCLGFISTSGKLGHSTARGSGQQSPGTRRPWKKFQINVDPMVHGDETRNCSTLLPHAALTQLPAGAAKMRQAIPIVWARTTVAACKRQMPDLEKSSFDRLRCRKDEALGFA